MHVLVTGHTGFKGAWFILLLKALGHDVSGVALDPPSSSLFSRARLSELTKHDFRLDVRDYASFERAVDKIKPDFAVHLAAQALVKTSYRNPRSTFETNVNGTLNFLSITQRAEELRGRLVITSDKVYRNDGRSHGYSELDSLGGRDPYSASKSMADVLTQSWMESYPTIPSAIGRAGNVIGGGDTAENRLVPDVIEAISSSQPINLRYPNAVRPWQHVLDCLSGYMAIANSLGGKTRNLALNVGPGNANMVSVSNLVESIVNYWGTECPVNVLSDCSEHEEGVLTLDSSLLRITTGWRNKLGLEETIGWTVDWEKSFGSGEDPRNISIRQVEKFLAL